MPRRWKHCVKIHEGCGGICRWVEAVEDPNVGYTGECITCGEEEIVVEGMIPLEGFGTQDLLDVSPSDLAELSWDDESGWEANQRRLGDEVPIDRPENNSFERRLTREQRMANRALGDWNGGDDTDA